MEDAIQCVDATTPKVPLISGRVVKGGGDDITDGGPDMLGEGGCKAPRYGIINDDEDAPARQMSRLRRSGQCLSHVDPRQIAVDPAM